MKKKRSKRLVWREEDMKWYTVEEVFRKVSKTKEFKEAYVAESQRLDLAYQLRELRRAKRLSQKAVAEKADMPQSVIARLESGEHNVSVLTLGKVARAFGKRVAIV